VRAGGGCSVIVIGKAAMGELLREHPALAQEIAQTMAARDAQRDVRTREMMHERARDDANTLLRRIRAFFAIN
jgi:CRP-like cAMP-binding protein